MDKALLRSLKIEQRFKFKGFDFAHLAYRKSDEPLPWSYVSCAIEEIRTTKPQVMVDMGTGGGEILSQMQPLPKTTFATESYKPNIKIAKEKLEPLGVKVVPAKSEDDLSAFEDGYFDLVINRHSSFNCNEIFRVLKSGGKFITQQVGGNNDVELMKLLGTKKGWKGLDDSLGAAVKNLKAAGMKVIKATEAYPKSRVYDAGALVYYLKAIPWSIPDFSIVRYARALSRIDSIIKRKGYVEFWQQRTFLIAKKP